VTDFEDDEEYEGEIAHIDMYSDCTCGRYNQCEHKNWMIDRETEVRKVVSKWVEDGSNMFPHGSHGNWIAGIKDDECLATDHTYCNNQEFDNTDAAGHQFDSRGFFIDIQPMPKPRVRMPVRESEVIRELVNNGLITQPEYDAMMNQLQRDYDRMRNNLRTASQPQPGRRYVEYPIHVSRNQGLIQRQERGGVPYTPDFRDDSGMDALRATLRDEDWEPLPVFNITTDERPNEF
jgi:hypothetical protein